MPSQGVCFFSQLPASVQVLGKYDGNSYEVNDRWNYWAAGTFLINYSDQNPFPEKLKYLCLQETILLNKQGLTPFWTSSDEEKEINPRVIIRSIEKIKNKLIDHTDKDRKILDLLAKKLQDSINPFDLTYLNLSDRYLIGIFSDDEYANWLLSLYKSELITFDTTTLLSVNGSDNSVSRQRFVSKVTEGPSIKLTVLGWDFVNSQKLGKNSKKVFVAMAFTDQAGQVVKADLREKIKSVLQEDKKWEPIIIDEIEHNDGIMDKVIGGINESRFVIAELTHQKSGVYYEAGYARGLGLPVIHIVNKADLKNCHFDVKHLNLITWETLEELAEKLKHRIKATII